MTKQTANLPSHRVYAVTNEGKHPTVGFRHNRLDAISRGLGEPHYLRSRPGSGHRRILRAPLGMGLSDTSGLTAQRNKIFVTTY